MFWRRWACRMKARSSRHTARPIAPAHYAKTAAERGLKVIIAAAGGAAHLAGVTAAMTTLPVLGVPMESQGAQRPRQPAIHRPNARRRSGRDFCHRRSRCEECGDCIAVPSWALSDKAACLRGSRSGARSRPILLPKRPPTNERSPAAFCSERARALRLPCVEPARTRTMMEASSLVFRALPGVSRTA